MTPQETLNLAQQRCQEGNILDAESLFRAVLAADPGHAECHFRLGRLLTDAGKLDDAIVCFRQAASLRPDLPATHFNLGVVLDRKLEFYQAITCYQRVLMMRPDDQPALNNLGAALCRTGQWAHAVATLQLAVRVAPTSAESQMNLGNAFMGLRDNDRAIEALNRALALRPDFLDAWNNLANAYKGCGLPAQALECYQKALDRNPDFLPVADNRLTALYLDPAQDSASILREHKAWNQRYAQPLAASIRPHEIDRAPDRRLKIGYLSAEFTDHVAARNLLPLLRNHDREKFDIFCYSSVQRPDAMTETLRSHSGTWRNIFDLPDDAVAAQIRADRIDILVDLTLHSPGNRLLVLARKPAPVQAVFIGYPGGTGMSAIDYRLTDPHLDPPGQTDADYVERSWRLAESFWCYDPDAMKCEPAADPNPLPAQANGYITFGCLNNFSKVNDGNLHRWAKVLQAVPNSRLRLLAPTGGPRQRVLQTLAAHAIAADRIDFVPPQSRPLYFAEYRHIDLCLDTLPYNGHTTSLDALWMGVPVITLIGPTVVGRAGLSQLSNLKLTELAASDDEQFIKIAVDLANDRPRLAELRRTLRDRMLQSPLTNGQRFAQNVEDAYRGMWAKASHVD